MAAELKVFAFENQRVRTIIDGDGAPWFVAKDVANVLGYQNTKEAMRDHCKYLKILKGSDSLPLTDSPRGIGVIPESDVYRLILRSKLPSAERFQAWVTEEVLPTIRQTGAYVTDAAAVSDPILAQARMVVEMRLKQIAQEQRLTAIERRVEALPAPTTHLSVLAFATLNDIRLDHHSASLLGKRCAARTRLSGGVIGAVADDHYGTVGSYPLEVLERVFAEAGLVADETVH